MSLLKQRYEENGKVMTYWNGEPTPCRRVQVVVGHVATPTWWCKEFEGTIRRAVEVDYHGQKFYLDNEDYPVEPDAGWHKVTVGLGGPHWGHKSLPVDRVLESWADVVQWLRDSLNREPTLEEMMSEVPNYQMTPEELKIQQESWAHSNVSTGDPRFD